jgi:hypothetical protein
MSWTGDNNDVFTETLTTVASIDRSTLDQVIVHFSGTVSDSLHLFMDTPAFFVLNATQFDGGGTATTVTFTNSAGAVTRSTVPEPSTWVMMDWVSALSATLGSAGATPISLHFSRKSQSLVEHFRKAASLAIARLAVSERVPLRSAAGLFGAATLASWTALSQLRWRTSALRCRQPRPPLEARQF